MFWFGRVTKFQDGRRPEWNERRRPRLEIVTLTTSTTPTNLFIPLEAGVRPGNFRNLPNQNIDSKGNISIPYAGTLRASGRTPAEVQESIVAALKNRAIEPQAVVALVDQRTSLISVLGEVNTQPASPPTRPASASSTRSPAAVAQRPGFRYLVMLEREGRGRPARLARWCTSRRTISTCVRTIPFMFIASRNPRAFGASGAQGQFNFDAWRISLAEAVGKAGGLNDTQADPGSVFVYRGETREVAERLGVDTTRFPDRLFRSFTT